MYGKPSEVRCLMNGNGERFPAVPRHEAICAEETFFPYNCCWPYDCALVEIQSGWGVLELSLMLLREFETPYPGLWPRRTAFVLLCRVPHELEPSIIFGKSGCPALAVGTFK